MNKLKTLQYSVGILILINIVVALGLVWKGAERNRVPHKRPHHNAQALFGFSDSEAAKFEQSVEKHVEAMREKRKLLNELSVSYYQSREPLEKDHVLDSLRHISDAVYKITDSHFNEIRALCNESNIGKMDEFISSLILRKPGPPRRRPDDG